jgi:hypothetical protein
MPSRVYSNSIEELLEDNTISIPEHQRPYIWDAKKASAFLETIMESLPTQSIFMYEEIANGELKRWLEDGQQRWLTVTKFVNNQFGDSVKWNSRKYSEFSFEEKRLFQSYKFTIQLMYNISLEKRLSLFQRLQDGRPLTNGQRFHACSHKPLVMLAKQIMTDPRCIAVWGRKNETASKTALANSMAIASGLALNNDNKIVSSYAILGEEVFKTTELDNDCIESRLAKLLDVYARVQELCPANETEKRKQWNVGLYTGYILYTMRQPDRDWEQDATMWVNYIVRVRRDKSAICILKHNAPASRNWNRERWQQGLENIVLAKDNPNWIPNNSVYSDEDDEE